jgi:hypothetical protein
MTPAPPAAVTPAARNGRAGLAATAVSIACTLALAAAGPSLLEPPLPGAAGQPPWALDLHLDPYLAVGLAAAGLAAGTLGVALTLRATRLGWTVRPRYVLLAGVIAAALAGTTRPFGTSDFLSYAAYGRELVTGHNPYLVAPEALARLGDPVARAVQDWAGTPSVYGALATGVFGIASLAGGTSARLTVFAVDAANVAAFIGTGLLLDRLSRRPAARLRAAVLWTCNPLLLQILVAGSHVDGLAVAPGIGALAVLAPVIPNGLFDDSLRATPLRLAARPGRGAARGALAGMLVGLGFAVKPTIALVGVGLAIGVVASSRNVPPAPAPNVPPAPAPNVSPAPAPNVSPAPAPNVSPAPAPLDRSLPRVTAFSPFRFARNVTVAAMAGLVAGFGVVAGADVLLIGRAGIEQTMRASGMVSVGSPWRVVRTLLSMLIGSPAADDAVRWGAVALALFLAVRLLRLRVRSGPGLRPQLRNQGRYSDLNCAIKSPAGACAFALVLAWLLAWPYVLPWYDALAWALLPLLPASRFDWLLLARTAVLGFGYLPARAAGITIPGGLRWMEPVLRSALVPVVLAVLLVMVIRWTARSEGPADADPGAAPPARLTGADSTSPV